MRSVQKSARPTLEELYRCSPKTIFDHIKTEHISFWLCCIYLVFEYVRPQSIYSAIAVLPWSALSAVFAFVFSFSTKCEKPKLTALSNLIIAYGIVVLLSSAFATYPQISVDKLSTYFSWVLIYFAITRTTRTREQFFILFLLYMLVNFKMSQHGFLSWARRGFAFTNWGVIGGPGWFHNSGEFGIQLCIFTPLVIAFIAALRQHWTRITRLFFYLMPLTAVGSAIATSSRGALVGLIGAGTWSLSATRYFIRTLAILSVVILAIYALTPPEFKARFQSSGEDWTSRHRLDRWHQGWAVIKEHPILGIGHENWPKYFDNYLDNTTVPGTSLVHNIFIQCGTEMGFMGLTVLCLLFLYMFILNRRTRKIAKLHGDLFSYSIAHGMDAATIGLIIASSFVTVLYYPYIWIHAAFISCLYSSVLNLEPPSQRSHLRGKGSMPNQSTTR